MTPGAGWKEAEGRSVVLAGEAAGGKNYCDRYAGSEAAN